MDKLEGVMNDNEKARNEVAGPSSESVNDIIVAFLPNLPLIGYVLYVFIMPLTSITLTRTHFSGTMLLISIRR